MPKFLDAHPLNGASPETLQKLQDSQRFNPSHYILVNWVGVHYELITYNEQSLFTWDELPRDVQELIVRHCG